MPAPDALSPLHLRAVDISVYDDLRRAQYPGGTDRSRGEFLFKDDERRLGLGLVREGVDVVEAGLDAEVEERTAQSWERR